jgi:23S rRNA pseudouridine1911/1915/1917 synthase
MPKTAPLNPAEVLFEDNHLLVINKRAGLVTQGAAAGEPSLYELAKDYIRIKYNKPGNVYLGIVSRLDAMTSGVIVVARTSKAAARLNQQFRDRIPKKIYWAIVGTNANDQPIADAGALENSMFKDESAHRMRCVKSIAHSNSNRVPKDAKMARLSWKVLGRHRDQSLLAVELETGRKHQIRCQLAAASFPILGDVKYGSSDPFGGPGIALHSKSIEFIHPTKKNMIQFDANVSDRWKIDRYNL